MLEYGKHISSFLMYLSTAKNMTESTLMIFVFSKNKSKDFVERSVEVTNVQTLKKKTETNTSSWKQFEAKTKKVGFSKINSSHP